MFFKFTSAPFLRRNFPVLSRSWMTQKKVIDWRNYRCTSCWVLLLTHPQRQNDRPSNTFQSLWNRQSDEHPRNAIANFKCDNFRIWFHLKYIFNCRNVYNNLLRILSYTHDHSFFNTFKLSKFTWFSVNFSSSFNFFVDRFIFY